MLYQLSRECKGSGIMGDNIRDCERYIRKQEMLGVKMFEFKCVERCVEDRYLAYDTDEVILVGYIENEESYRRVVIPEFVSKLDMPFYNINQNISVAWKDNININNRNLSWIFNQYNGKELDINEIDTNRVTNMEGMFLSCMQLHKLNISNIDTSKVSNMGRMFKGCTRIESLDLNNFNTQNVRRMESMFMGCMSLKELNLSSFEVTKLVSANKMFAHCHRLEKIILKNVGAYNVLKNLDALLECDTINIKFEFIE